MKIEKNQTCKKLGHEFTQSRIFDELFCCRVCGIYKKREEIIKVLEKTK